MYVYNNNGKSLNLNVLRDHLSHVSGWEFFILLFFLDSYMVRRQNLNAVKEIRRQTSAAYMSSGYSWASPRWHLEGYQDDHGKAKQGTSAVMYMRVLAREWSHDNFADNWVNNFTYVVNVWPHHRLRPQALVCQIFQGLTNICETIQTWIVGVVDSVNEPVYVYTLMVLLLIDLKVSLAKRGM